MVEDKQKPKLGDIQHQCVVCHSAHFVEGKGWIGEHTFPCANDNYGWLYTIKCQWNGKQWMPVKD